jgi:predicted  nucleic acid-binding Zn-ribbon protein
LSKAHIAAQVAVEAVGTTKKAGIESNISTKKGEIANFSTQITQIDAAISKATEKGRTNAAMQLSVDQNRRRTELATKLAQANTELAALNVQMATANGAQKVAEADLGQVRYLATLLGVEDELVLRWFILLVAALLDPAAVLLLLAATRR